MGCHCGAPAAVGTGVLRALVAAERTGEPVSGPRAVEAGKAEIPERARKTRRPGHQTQRYVTVIKTSSLTVYTMLILHLKETLGLH